MSAKNLSSQRTRSTVSAVELNHWLLDVLAVMRAEFSTLMSLFPDQQQTRMGTLEAWAPKDELAHLAFWLETFVTNLQNLQGHTPLIDTRDYLTMNNQAWMARKDWTWADIQHALAAVLAQVEIQIRRLSAEDLTDANRLTLEGDRKSPRPLVRSFLYELVDHPLHHVVGLYQRLGADSAAQMAMLLRVQSVLSKRGLAKWTATSRRKLQAYLTASRAE